MPNRRDVLVFSIKNVFRSTVRSQYLKWRQANKTPVRCDNQGCVYFSDPMVWNGRELKPIIDHINGNSQDNRPANLRLLCPNCDSQLETRGGRNRGRILNATSQGYNVKLDEDRMDAVVFLVGVSGKGSAGGYTPEPDGGVIGSEETNN